MLDSGLPRALFAFIRTVISSVEIIVTIAWAVPNFTLILPPLMFVYGAVLVGPHPPHSIHSSFRLSHSLTLIPSCTLPSLQ